jgi:hypothetical protein
MVLIYMPVVLLLDLVPFQDVFHCLPMLTTPLLLFVMKPCPKRTFFQ